MVASKRSILPAIDVIWMESMSIGPDCERLEGPESRDALDVWLRMNSISSSISVRLKAPGIVFKKAPNETAIYATISCKTAYLNSVSTPRVCLF